MKSLWRKFWEVTEEDFDRELNGRKGFDAVLYYVKLFLPTIIFLITFLILSLIL